MRRLILIIAVLSAALYAVQPPLSAQKQGQVFIKLVGADGKPVTDLQASEVSITEDGVACKTVKVEPVDWPIKLQVLVDNGKNNTNPINPMRDGLAALFELIPEGVETSLYTTSPQPRPIVKPTTDKALLIKGIPVITPDGGAGAFFDALFEASQRIEKDNKTPYFPVLLMVGSDFGRLNINDRDFQKLQQTILARAITVHVIVTSGGGGGGGAAQTEIGLALTKMTGGRYENINTPTRLATLLPEFGKRIAESSVKQAHQFRVTYEHPANAKGGAQIGASVTRQGTPTLTLDGHMP